LNPGRRGGKPATNLLSYGAALVGDGDCGEIGGIKIGRGNRIIWKKKPTGTSFNKVLEKLLAMKFNTVEQLRKSTTLMMILYCQNM
jgi:hypothetical protein